MASRTGNERSHSFFKQYFPKHGYDGVKIPDAFVEKHPNGLPKKAVLQNSMGKLWQVEMGYTDSGVFFLNGWRKFVSDNSVEHGDFLVFKYDGDHRFEINIFGKSACEKRETSADEGVHFEVKIEEEEDEDEGGVVVIDVDDDHGGENEEEESEARTMMKCRGKKESEDGGCKRAGVNGGDVRNHLQPQNPYFVTKLRKFKKNLLFVPSHFLKNFELQLAEDIIFQDKVRRKWQGKLVIWNDGRKMISGWAAVCKWNHVGEDDLCICEFPQRKGDKQDIIEVHIVRGFGSGSLAKTET